MATSNVAQFTGTLSTSTYPNKYNVVIPPEGPFFRTGLVVKNAAGTKLIEGIDYYLGYYFKEAAEALKDQIYGGIMLLGTDKSITYEIYSAGRDYRVPQTEIGKFLVREDIKDPRNVDWSELMRYAPIVAPIDPPGNLEEALLRDEVVKALDDIRTGLLEHARDMDEAYGEVTDLIFANGKKIFDDNLYQHHTIKNAHQYTAEEIGALKVLAKAIDATKAFGRTIDQLVDVMAANGIQQAHIDTLMPVVLGELRGRLKVLNNGALTFRTADSSHVITLQGEKFLITTTKALNITADAGNTTKGLAVEMGAGLNTLYAHSGAPAPVFNGAYLVTPDMVSLYLSEVKLMPGNAYFAGTDDVKIFGNAKEPSPVTMSATAPTATKTTAGLFLVTNLSANIAAGAAISQKAVNALKLTLDQYVDSTYTVNGKKFVDANNKQELTLTAADVGIGNMDNTAPLKKPLTTAINLALANKAKGDHTHVFADLINVPTANDTVAGLVQLWDAIDNTTNKVVTSKQGYNVQQRINQYRKTVNGLLPVWTTGGAAYGNSGFLPIPTVSNYAGFGFFRVSSYGHAAVEGDTVYSLRNGTDGPTESEQVYYWYSKLASNGKMLKAVPTTRPYHPVGLNKFPGVYLSKIIIAGDGVSIFTGSDGKAYMVLFGGTMNSAMHTQVYQVIIPNGKRSTGEFSPLGSSSYCTITLTDKTVVLMQHNLSKTGFFIGAWKVSRSELAASDKVDFKVMNLLYPTKDGDAVNFVEDGDIVDDDTQTKKIAYSTAAGRAKWTTGRNVCNYRPSFMSAAKGEKIRLRTEGHGYFTTTFGGEYSNAWACLYNLDVDTGQITLETDTFPLAVTENKIETPKGDFPTSLTGRNWPSAWQCNYFASGGYLIGVICSAYGNSPPIVEISTLNGVDYYDALANKNRLSTINALSHKGAAGSVYVQYMRMGIHLGGDDRKIMFRYLNDQTFIVSKYDLEGNYFPEYPGYGPDNERYSISADVGKAIARTPNLWKDGKLTLNGQTIDEPGTYAYKTIPGTTTFTSDRIIMSASAFNSLAAAMVSEIPLTQDPLTESYLTSVQVFDIGGANLALMYCTVRTWSDESKLRAYNRTWIWKVPMSVDAGGNLSFMTGSLTPVLTNWYDSAASTNLARDQHMNSKLIYRDDGYVIMLGGAYKHGVVGDTRWASFLLTCDKSWSDWTSELFRVNPSVGEQDIFLMPETGLVGITKWMYNGMYYGVDLTKVQSRKFRGTAVTANIIAGVKTAEGWELYVTEEESLRFGSEYYTLPEYNADIRDLYPGAYRNRTFYMHAAVVNKKAEYQLLESQLPDTDSRLYIGTVVTDDVRITSSQFEKVKRLGTMKQILEHQAVAYRHDVEVMNERTLSPLGLLRKEPRGNITAEPGAYFDSGYDVNVIGMYANLRIPRAVKLTGLTFAPEKEKASAFAPEVVVTQISSASNSKGAASGAYWLGVTDLNSVAKLARSDFKVTPSKSKLRVRVYLPKVTNGALPVPVTVMVEGVAAVLGSVTFGDELILDVNVTANKAVSMSIEFNYAGNNSPDALMGYTVSDLDGSTESKILTSGVGSTVAVLANSIGLVYSAIEIPLTGETGRCFPVVAMKGIPETPPMLIKNDSIIVATRWHGYTDVFNATEVTVNLMPTM